VLSTNLDKYVKSNFMHTSALKTPAGYLTGTQAGLLRLQSNQSRKSPQAASAPLVLGAVLAAEAVPAEALPFLPATYNLVPTLV